MGIEAAAWTAVALAAASGAKSYHDQRKLKKQEKKSARAQEAALRAEQAESARRRTRLIENTKGTLGEEVDKVGMSGDTRGNVFGNN